jgi:hypothetical protein
MARGTRIRFAPELCDRPSRFGGVHLEVLWPCPRYDAALGLNDNSPTCSRSPITAREPRPRRLSSRRPGLLSP